MKSIIKRLFICLMSLFMGSQLSFAQHRPDGLPQGHSIGNGGITRKTSPNTSTPTPAPAMDLWDGAKVMEEV